MERMTVSRWRRGEDLFRPDGYADGIGELVADKQRHVPNDPTPAASSTAARWLQPPEVPRSHAAVDPPVVKSRQTPLERHPDRFSFNDTGFRAHTYAMDVRREADRVRSEAERVRSEAHRLRDEASQIRQAADEFASNVRAEAEEMFAQVTHELEEINRRSRDHVDLHRLEVEQELERRRRAVEQAVGRVSESAMSELAQRELGVQRAERIAIQRLTNAARDIAHALEQMLEMPVSSRTDDIDLATIADSILTENDDNPNEPFR